MSPVQGSWFAEELDMRVLALTEESWKNVLAERISGMLVGLSRSRDCEKCHAPDKKDNSPKIHHDCLVIKAV